MFYLKSTIKLKFVKAGCGEPVKRQRCKNILLGILFFSLVAITPALSDPAIKLVGPNSVWPEFIRVDLTSLKSYEEILTTIDPNFKKDGVTEFRGIRIPKLLEIANISSDQDLTIIGADQYVGFLPKEKLADGLLVWEMNQKPIRGLKGGPLKIVFPETAGIHTSCYTWYVDAIVAGTAERAELTVVSGSSQTRYRRADLLAHARPLTPSLFSIAQGCRNEFKDQSTVAQIKAVPLTYFLSPDQLDPADPEKMNAIVLKPFSGPQIQLAPDILNYPVFVLVACDDHPLHPSLGGPFSIVFPVEDHPRLQGMVPESGALFFLEKIIVK